MPIHIVLVGLMGSGKTAVGTKAAERIDLPFRDGDDVLERRTGGSPADLAEADGLDALHREEAAVLLDLLAAEPPTVIAAAASTIEDAQCRAALVPHHVVWLDAPITVLADRAAAGDHRPLPGARDIGEVGAMLAEQFVRREPWYRAVSDQHLDVFHTDAEAAAEAILVAAGQTER